ncbi:protein of unknown function [Xenorhabdus doucetiae]|uniref:Uncharacterized protein n=1 Tax=Xenorhabdus doucetiae TaxID=351671 RepID=A0A068QRT2_9GAMM|nr:hypothetical protein LY16_00107 [Xenorhabdus doucetiae]CDG17326.1 protein of unknown function [Xenorhabdus doucetiae]
MLELTKKPWVLSHGKEFQRSLLIKKRAVTRCDRETTQLDR